MAPSGNTQLQIQDGELDAQRRKYKYPPYRRPRADRRYGYLRQLFLRLQPAKYNSAGSLLMTLAEVYNSLMTGQKVQIQFETPVLASNFRVNLHHHKRRQDAAMVACGLMEEKEKAILRFELDKEKLVAKIEFVLKKESKREYAVTIIEEPNNEQESDHS